MNYLSQEKDKLNDFHNLLHSRINQEARSLSVCKQQPFQSLSKTIVRSANLMQQLSEDVIGGCFCNVFSSRSQTNYVNRMGLWSEFLFLYYLVTSFLHLVTIFFLMVAKRRIGIFFYFLALLSVGFSHGMLIASLTLSWKVVEAWSRVLKHSSKQRAHIVENRVDVWKCERSYHRPSAQVRVWINVQRFRRHSRHSSGHSW